MLRIRVTQEEICRGEATTSKCPIAASILKSSDKVEFVFVNQRVVNVGYWQGGIYRMKRYRPSKRMIRFIRDFDLGLKVRPTVFYLWDCIHLLKERKTTLGEKW